MPLEAPKLDNRSFEDIYREALLRIPRYTPEWTDFNESDPGITLLQLFSWLSEMMLYEMNQIPERNYIKFLQLLNMELRPAEPARAFLTVTVPDGSDVSFVRRGAQLLAQPPDSDPLTFETERGLSLIRLPLSHVQVFDGTSFTVVSSANETAVDSFRPFGWVPQIGSALYLGFGQPETPLNGRLFPQEMRFRVFLPVAAQLGKAQNIDEAEKPLTPPVSLVWEYKPKADSLRWRRLNVSEDKSCAFMRDGDISVEGPSKIDLTVEGKVPQPCYWLRCRLTNGAYPAGKAPVIDFVRPNVVEVAHLSTIRDEYIAASEGFPDQVFHLRHTPVQSGSLQLVTESDGEQQELWQRVDDFLASGPDDRHYLFNATSGELQFGDGRNGRIPVAGRDIVAQFYRFGGGDIGNVDADMINTPYSDLGNLEITNERPAVGGRDEETLESLKAKAPTLLRSRNRAVTSEDFATLAEQAGGIARATAIPLAHPDFPDVKVPGAVTVIVVPDNEDKPPRPTADELRAVARYLNRFRLLTTEVFVKEPCYVPIHVMAEVEAESYASFDAVSQDIAKAINDALDPLGYHLAQGGVKVWQNQFGADFHPTNLYRVILNVAGVHRVKNLEVEVNGRLLENGQRENLSPDCLVFGVENHDIRVAAKTDY